MRKWKKLPSKKNRHRKIHYNAPSCCKDAEGKDNTWRFVGKPRTGVVPNKRRLTLQCNLCNKTITIEGTVK